MKKFILLLSLFAFIFISCEGPMGPPGEPGRPGEPGDGMWWFVKEYTIKPNQWILEGGANQLNSYFRYEIKISELDLDVFRDGKVNCYVYVDENSNSIQAELPYVRHKGDVANDGSDILWTETYDYDFAVESIMLYVTYSDFYTEGNLPEHTKFRVVLNY